MTRAALVALLLGLGLPLPAATQDLKTIESHLKADYAGKLAKLTYTPEVDGFRLELPKEERKSVVANTRLYLQVEGFELKKNELRFVARRVVFYKDLDDNMQKVQGREASYRLRWSGPTPSEAVLRRILETLLPVRGSPDDEWVTRWGMNGKPESSGQTGAMKPSEEVAAGVYRIGGGVTARCANTAPHPSIRMRCAPMLISDLSCCSACLPTQVRRRAYGSPNPQDVISTPPP